MISKHTIPQARVQRKAVQMIAGPVADDWGRWAGVRPVCPFLAAGGRICKKNTDKRGTRLSVFFESNDLF